MRNAIRASIVLLVAMFLPILGTSAANAYPTSPCHGYVYNLYKSGGFVRMTYWIYCDYAVDKIQMQVFLRQGDRWSDRNVVTCYNARYCQDYEQLADPSGSQLYSARAVESPDMPITYAKNGNYLWGCNDPFWYMKCTGDGGYF